MIVYFDTSAIVKLMIPETNAQIAMRLWDETDLGVTSVLAHPETRSALAAAKRAGRLSARRHEEGKRSLDDWFGELYVVDVTDEIVLTAGDLAEEHALRAYDAVHLASALSMGDDLTLATWDADLTRAARASGLSPAGIG